MAEEKQQSQSWEKYRDNHDGQIRGFPFNEGFPTGGPFGNVRKWYELILETGQRVRAQVDFSTQYRAEGLQWRTEAGKTLDKHVVAAWKEAEGRAVKM